MCVRARSQRGEGIGPGRGNSSKGWEAGTQDGVREEGRGWVVSLADHGQNFGFYPNVCVCEPTVRIEAKG